MISILSAAVFATFATAGDIVAPPTVPDRELTTAQMEILLTGNTLHIQVGDAGQAAIYFDADGMVSAMLPNGTSDKGTWNYNKASAYCIRWERGPKLSCTSIRWSPGGIRLSDAEGKPRGSVVRIVLGDDLAKPPSKAQ